MTSNHLNNVYWLKKSKFIKKLRIYLIDSNENINLLKNDSNFGTLHLPKCLP